jgi:hypothetical protein
VLFFWSHQEKKSTQPNSATKLSCFSHKKEIFENPSMDGKR